MDNVVGHSSAGNSNSNININGNANDNSKMTGKFFPKTLAARPRWRKPSKESFGSNASSEEDPRGRALSRDSGLDDSMASLSTAASQSNDELDNSDNTINTANTVNTVNTVNTDETLLVDAEFNQDAAATFERDPDRASLRSSSPVRPTIPSTHPSHIGQLTTSSPIIQAEHISENRIIHRSSLGNLSSSAAAPHERTSRPSTSGAGLDVPHSRTQSRSKSPAGRIRDVFRTKKPTSSALGASTEAGTTEQKPAAEASKVGPHTNDTKLASPERSHRPKSRTKVDISIPPRTPPSESARPIIVNTPPTPTDFSSPRGHREHRGSARESSPAFASPAPSVPVASLGNTIAHRRARSGSASILGPSKLSNTTLAPLTPTPENPTTAPLTPGSGFFSNVFSAAQNAASTLTSTITSTGVVPGGAKPKSIPSVLRPEPDDRVQVDFAVEPAASVNMGERELAVKTLGSGELSLSQLGLSENDLATPTQAAPQYPADEVPGSRGRSDSAPGDPPRLFPNGDAASEGPDSTRTASLYEQPSATSSTSVYEEKSNAPSTGSIKNGRRRKRGGTADTGGTNTSSNAGGTVTAVNPSAAQPPAAPKLTGFAVASKKRNRDFHTLFKSVPDDDYLIEDYSCALQREILAHGRLYVSEGHLCFSSNIFGWVTTLVMSFDEIISVEKRSTALVFKNGLMISTLHAKHVFASFTSRDSTYDLIINIWKLGHPTLRSSLNGMSLDEVGGDKTVKVTDNDGAAGSRSALASEEEDEEDGSDDGDIVYDEDDEDEDVHDAAPFSEAVPAEVNSEKAISRKASGLNGVADKTDSAPAAGGPPDFPGPATHAPTDCGDTDTHYDISIADDVVGAPLGKVYDLIFGPTSVTFMSKWLTGEQKCFDLQMEDKKGLTQDNKSRNFSYIKPLNAAIGPKQTKCIVTETIDQLDFEKSVNVSITTQNPDVPSGNVFSVKTKYCMSWAENNATRVTVNCTIEWTGKSWIKGPIEKGAKDGQTQYCKELFATLKAEVSSRTRAGGSNGAKGKKKKGKGKLQESSKESVERVKESAASKPQDWGMFEPLHDILGPVVDIIGPIFPGNLLYGLLAGLLLAYWFGSGSKGRQTGHGYGRDIAFKGYPERAVAYEEIWRREESDLWDWLEERVGLHRMGEEAAPVRSRAAEPRSIAGKVREERMSEREIEEAIRVTEEKLQVLKSVVDRKKVAMPTADGHRKFGRPTTNVPATEI